jgi:hypothetical protein
LFRNAGTLVAVSSLLYVSKSLVPVAAQAGELHHIVGVARARNERLSVTGALLYTEEHFAQILEGPAAAVAELMEHIAADPRHTRLKVIWTDEPAGRSFADWSLAYSGPSRYVDRYIRPFYDGEDRPDGKAIRSLLKLIRELARPQPPPRIASAGRDARA